MGGKGEVEINILLITVSPGKRKENEKNVPQFCL